MGQKPPVVDVQSVRDPIENRLAAVGKIGSIRAPIRGVERDRNANVAGLGNLDVIPYRQRCLECPLAMLGDNAALGFPVSGVVTAQT